MKSKILLENIYLDFPIYESESFSFRNKITSMSKSAFSRMSSEDKGNKVVHGLKDINFTFNHGDKIALLGPNGSGKTTLLKLLSGIYSPTSGKIVREGDISCMIDIGFGFQSDATGYENIIYAGISRGLRKKDIEKIMPEIVDFSGLGEFLDMPLRTYSSGMQARLAFSTAIASAPGILLMDEFFSTGDLEFSKKSKDKVLEMMDASSILIFASHDLELLKTLCNKAICLKHGQISYYGNTEEAIDHYKEFYEK
tara:strand:+ start:827 stop:1588 length:762 start_codon:yes stop_codon:yes gene_type:complete